MPVLSEVLDSKVGIGLLKECGYIGLWSSLQKYIRKVFLDFYNICNYLFMIQLTCNLF